MTIHPSYCVLELFARFRFQRKTKPQRHALDCIRGASENFRRVFQRSRRLGQLHEPAVFLERPGLARHNRNDPLVDTRTKPPSGPMFARRLCLGGAGLGGARCDDGYAIGETSQQTTRIKLTAQPYRDEIGTRCSVQPRCFRRPNPMDASGGRDRSRRSCTTDADFHQSRCRLGR